MWAPIGLKSINKKKKGARQMPKYTVEFEAVISEYGTVELDANSVEEAEEKADHYIRDMYGDGLVDYEYVEVSPRGV